MTDVIKKDGKIFQKQNMFSILFLILKELEIRICEKLN